MITFTTSGAILCLKKLKDHYTKEHTDLDTKCKNKKTPLRDRTPFITARAATKEKLDNIAAIIANMNELIQKFTPYFPHLKGVKVGKTEAETLVLDKFEKPVDAGTAKKKKKKKKKSKVVAVEATQAEAEVTVTAAPQVNPVVEADQPAVLPAVQEPEATPVVASDDKPVELPVVPEAVVVKETVASPAPRPTLDRSISVKEVMTVDERRRMLDERRKSRLLQRTESGRFVEGVDYKPKSSKPPLKRTQSVLFTRVSRVDFARNHDQKTYDIICQEHPQMIAEIMADPWATSGHGSPERLSGDFAGCFSRRLNEKDRLVYRADRDKDGNVILTIMSVSGHYTRGKS